MNLKQVWWRAQNEDGFWRAPAIIGLLILLVVLLLPGCSGVRFGSRMEQFAPWYSPEAKRATKDIPPLTLHRYEWTQIRGAAPQPWRYIYVDHPQDYCVLSSTGHVGKACAHYSEEGCVIILPKDAPDDLREHEEKHCDGWVHQ